MSWWSRLANVFQSDRLDRELDEEQRFHIETRADELEAGGLSRQAALDQAERQFGPRLQLRESSRDARLMSWLESLSRDLLFGLRLLRKDSLVSLAAILSLGLAIGACTAAFSLIDALILRQLPVADPERLVYLRRPGNDSGNPSSSTMTNYPFFEHVRQTTSSHMEAFSMSHQSLRQAVLPDAGGVEEKLQTQFVSGNAFVVLGVRSAIGRAACSLRRCHAGRPSRRGRQSRILDTAAGGQSCSARAMDPDRAEGLPDRRCYAGRICRRAAGNSHRHLASKRDVSARGVQRRPVAVAPDLGTSPS